ncbi:MAG: dephospho-CoA kinase [Campylobacteraceae bacterium]|jgi:dephospho-CoA kinase|nr:dephospho-CoA kinase [Campylobacteraceae bacterium]
MDLRLKIVLTGGIASGKSSVCKILRTHGFFIIDADDIAHKVLNENTDKIAAIFGKEYVKNGAADRKKLGKLVFSDKVKKEFLESILHKGIYETIAKEAENFEKLKKPYIADIPLFFEKDGVYKADLVVVVYASKEQQLKRLMERMNLSEKEAKSRLDAQIDIEIKKQKADIVIDNSKDSMHLYQEVKKFIDILKEKYAGLQI